MLIIDVGGGFEATCADASPQKPHSYCWHVSIYDRSWRKNYTFKSVTIEQTIGKNRFVVWVEDNVFRLRIMVQKLNGEHNKSKITKLKQKKINIKNRALKQAKNTKFLCNGIQGFQPALTCQSVCSSWAFPPHLISESQEGILQMTEQTICVWQKMNDSFWNIMGLRRLVSVMILTFPLHNRIWKCEIKRLLCFVLILNETSRKQESHTFMKFEVWRKS